MSVTGAKAVKANFKRIFNNINDVKTPKFVGAVISIGVNHSKELTPIAYSNLINSIVTSVDINKERTVGVVAYMAEYAVYLNGDETSSPLWKPVPLPKYEVKGGRKLKDGSTSVAQPGAPATNMDAKPRFLNRGFEDPESVALIKKAEKIFKI